MVFLVSGLDIVEYGQGLFGSSGIYHYFLETAFESAVLLYVHTILVESSGADALYFTTGKSRLEQVCGIHRALGIACTDNSVNLVDEKYNVGAFLQLVDNSFDTLFEFSAILRSCHYRCHVERYDAFVEKYSRYFTAYDAEGEAFDNCRFAYARFSDEHRIVLLPSAENLCQTFDFGFSSHNRVEAAFFGGAGHVVAEFIKHRRVSVALVPCRCLAVAARLTAARWCVGVGVFVTGCFGHRCVGDRHYICLDLTKYGIIVNTCTCKGEESAH